jgi:hypothetical protein
MPEIITGNASKLQVGAQSNWSTAVAPTVGLSFTSEDIRLVPNYIQSGAMLGYRTVNRMDITDKKIEGSFSVEVKPDEIGILLSALLGAEASPAAVDGSAVYDHVFTPISAVVGSSLPKVTLVADRVVSTKGYVGIKLDSMDLEARPREYLSATFNVRGYNEASDAAESLTLSTLRPFIFSDLEVQIDSTTYEEIQSARLSYNNNLEDDLFGANGSDKMIEIEPQGRDIQLTLEGLYSSDTDTLRTNTFVAGDDCSVTLTFTHGTDILTDKPYTLTIEIPRAYVTEASPNVPGRERIQQPLTLVATENASNVPITITLRDGESSAYIS